MLWSLQNRVGAFCSWNYFYDKNGNLIQKKNINTGEVFLFGYDVMNRLTSVTDTTTSLAMQATYIYDAFGQRIEKDVWNGSTTTTKFVYDQSQIWADLTSGNSLDTRYVNGDMIDEWLARVSSGGTVAWFLTDRLGSVRNVVNSSGTLIATLAYDGYGKATTESSPSNSGRIGFTGRERENETGFNYNRERYYDPNTGRWIEPDPLGFAAGDTNLDRYVGNNPTNLIDPYGLDQLIPTKKWFGKFHFIADMNIPGIGVINGINAEGQQRAETAKKILSSGDFQGALKGEIAFVTAQNRAGGLGGLGANFLQDQATLLLKGKTTQQVLNQMDPKAAQLGEEAGPYLEARITIAAIVAPEASRISPQLRVASELLEGSGLFNKAKPKAAERARALMDRLGLTAGSEAPNLNRPLTPRELLELSEFAQNEASQRVFMKDGKIRYALSIGEFDLEAGKHTVKPPRIRPGETLLKSEHTHPTGRNRPNVLGSNYDANNASRFGIGVIVFSRDPKTGKIVWGVTLPVLRDGLLPRKSPPLPPPP